MFETGATNVKSNKIVLSVVNDGAVYNDCVHAAKRLLCGDDIIHSFRDIANDEANKQRVAGSRFKASEITEASNLLQNYYVKHVIELIRNDYLDNGKPIIIAECRHWFDKTNGNNYFSVSLGIAGNIINIPFQYGYGSQWQYQVIRLLERHSFIPKLPVYENGNKDYGCISDYEENGVIVWHDLGYMKKNQMFSGMYI